MSVRAKATEMAISKIRPDGGTQTRAGLTQETIDEYAEAMREGGEFPPVVVFHDKKASAYWRGWSDRRIAEHCGVDHKTVTKWRGELESTGEIPQLIERKSLDGKARDIS